MRFPRKILLLSLVFDVALIGVVIFLFLRNNGGGSVSSAVSSGGSSSPVWIVMIPAVMIVIGLSILPFMRTLFPQAIRNGVRAEATVLKVWDTGVSINTSVQVGILLEVHPSMAPTFQAETKKLVSRINPNAFQQGMTVQVIYDPNNPKRIEITSIPESGGSQEYTQATTSEMRLRELNNLREKDLISKDEYDKKRDEILKNL